MPRIRILTALAGAALGVSMLGACSAESLAEFGLEQAIEASAEGDVDIDFSDGGFSVDGEDGQFSIAFDEETGAVVFDSDEGGGSIVFDEETGSVVYDTDEGSGTITIDEDNGSIVFDTDEGDGSVNFTEGGITIDAEGTENDSTLNFNDDGGATVTSDAGTAYFGVTTQPDDWPSIIAPPASNIDGQTVYSAFGDAGGFVYSAQFAHDANEPFAQSTVDRLLAAGYTSQFEMTTPEGTSNSLTNGEFAVTVIEAEAGSTMVMLMPA